MALRFFVIIFGYITTIALSFFLTNVVASCFNDNSLTENLINFKGSANSQIDPITFFVFGVLIAPFFEEIIFRYHLKDLKLIDFLLSISFYFFFISFSNLDFITTLSLKNINYISLLLSFILISLRYKVNDSIALNSRYRYLIVAISSLFFGILHFVTFDQVISNFNNWRYFTELIIKSITIIFVGFYFSFLRLKFGLTTAMLIHFMTNFLAFIFKFII